MRSEGEVIDKGLVRRLDEASEWLLRLNEPTRTDVVYEDWLRWCDADPENFAAFEAVQRQWQALDALKADKLFAVSRHARGEEWDKRSPPRSFKTGFALAASLAVLALGGFFIQRHLTAPPDVPRQIVAELTNRAATLPDGSKMILGKQTLVNMDFNGSRRELDLSSGEAYFDVKHDKERPFVVQAGEVSVTAIGTAFDIRRYPDKVTVTVEEGVVEVAGHAPGKKPVTWRAEAGHQLTYSIRERTASIASVNPTIALSWRGGKLAYVYEPLGSVIEDLNRYSTRKIIIADPEVADIRFTGTAFAAALGGWLAGVEQAYAVEVSESASGDIVLRSRQ